MKQRGRPSKYTDKIASELCLHIAGGGSLRAYCDKPNVPTKATIMIWLLQKPEFNRLYSIAREIQRHNLAEEILAIADNADLSLEERRIRVGARKWFASKLTPKKHCVEPRQTELIG